MIDNRLIQKALVAKLKDTAAVTAICTADEIREGQWQGKEFKYPNVRVALGTQIPLINWDQCAQARASLAIHIYSEKRSSQQADQLAYEVNVALHKKSWDETSDSFRVHRIRSVGLNSAIRMTDRVWRAQALFNVDVHTI